MSQVIERGETDLVEHWHDSLEHVDPGDLRATVRPRSSDTRSTDTAEPARPASVTPGLEDLDGLVASRDRFFLGSMLGRGGTSVVLSAVQRTLARTVAVKIARYDLDSGQRERFRTEAKCTAWLEHPHIVPVYEAGRNFLVMRRIVGSSLEEEILAGRTDLAGAVEILIKVCDAVAFAHHRGIIHRDIKPENILVGSFGEVVLADWGLALTCTPPSDGVLRAPLIGSGRTLCGGTPGYLAPEIALADRPSVGFATDVFLLGATLYRLLSDEVPFSGDDVWQAISRSAANEWRPLRERVPLLPARLVALQEQAMGSDPRRRPTVREFQTALRDWLLHSRAESAALRELAAAQRHLLAAQGHRLHPHEAYLDFSEAIAACDRAHALNPHLEAVRGLRETACRDFTLAAVGAGEPQLARLIKQSGRLNVLASLPSTEQPGDSSTVRRIANLVPDGGVRSVDFAKLMQDRQQLRQSCAQLSGEVASLQDEASRLRTTRDALAGRCAERHCQLRLRRQLHLALLGLSLLGLATVLLLVALLHG
jgi:predicted Ser/Thr protein kinase